METLSRRSIYVLSIWQERPPSADGPAVWRIRVENVCTGEKRAFTNSQDVLVFLKKQMMDRPSSGTAQLKEDAS